ncbi:hypothetical protein [Kitasatospora sp. HPMI-4]|uniref:hypothetical protein n=1 Tax=Kitasatospora sp. HPMI-4 TaxID=3448443 RepID=UPI003F1E14E4
MLKLAECDEIAAVVELGERRSVHRLHRYVPLVVWKWGGISLLVASLLIVRAGHLWPAVGVLTGGLAVLGGIGLLTVPSGLQAVLVYDGGLVLAADKRSVGVPWAFVEWTVHMVGDHDTERISGGRERLTVHHEMSMIWIVGMDVPVELLHVRRHRSLIESIDAQIEPAVEARLRESLRTRGLAELPGGELTLTQDGLVVTDSAGHRTMVAWTELTAVTQPAHSSLLIHARTLRHPVPVEVANARAVLRLIEQTHSVARPAREA